MAKNPQWYTWRICYCVGNNQHQLLVRASTVCEAVLEAKVTTIKMGGFITAMEIYGLC